MRSSEFSSCTGRWILLVAPPWVQGCSIVFVIFTCSYASLCIRQRLQGAVCENEIAITVGDPTLKGHCQSVVFSEKIFGLAIEVWKDTYTGCTHNGVDGRVVCICMTTNKVIMWLGLLQTWMYCLCLLKQQ